MKTRTAKSSKIRCECGKISGERCQRDNLRPSEVYEIEWMPEHLRESHIKAGNSGVYPYNGALRLTVSSECLNNLKGSDGDWLRVFGQTRSMKLVVGKKPKEKITYYTKGSVRGRCPHTHRTVSGAITCLERDQSGCRSQGGYSDRAVYDSNGECVPTIEVVGRCKGLPKNVFV